MSDLDVHEKSQYVAQGATCIMVTWGGRWKGSLGLSGLS